MTDRPPLPRSPELMNATDTGVLLVDAQEKLLAVVPDAPRIVWNCRRLLDAAKVLGVPIAATEQYPEKLGPTAAELRMHLDAPASKTAFSGAGCAAELDDWKANGRYRVLVCGIETHVCIEQTALDLTADGWLVYVAADAVGTRCPIDHQIALRRMEAAGVIITTTEAAIFEWCRDSGTSEFKQVSALAKELPP
jgi:nicotinamidase-related amidase